MNLIEKLVQMKIPTDSYIGAVQNFNDRARDGQLGEMRLVLANLVGDAVQPMKDPYVRIQIAYLIQEAVKHHINDLEVSTEVLVNTATRKAQEYVDAHPWVFAGDVPEQKVDVEGNVIPQRKRGAKQEHAAQVFARMKGAEKADILKAFIDEVGLTKAGAMTYYYNLKKQQAA